MEFMHERKYSRIESESPDPEEFPLYYKARKTVVEIEAGDMLFIPAGMFHFVISEKGDDTDGLNIAVNFWYETTPNPREHMISKHNIYDISFIKGDKRMEFYKSKTNLFPPKQLLHRYPGLIDFDIMSFNEFLVTKNPHYYLLQNMDSDTDKLLQYSPEKTSKVYLIGTWANFGKGATSLIHYDENDNWLCQVRGKKRVVLFPNEDRNLLYMWNPLDINIINKLSENHFMNFFVNNKQKIPDDLIPKNTCYFKNEYMSLILKNQIIEYEQRLIRLNCIPPSSILPWKFEIIKTNNVEYPKVSKYKSNFPYILLWVISGKGYIKINNTYNINIEPCQFFMFPNSFMFNWLIIGDIEFITICT